MQTASPQYGSQRGWLCHADADDFFQYQYTGQGRIREKERERSSSMGMAKTMQYTTIHRSMHVFDRNWYASCTERCFSFFFFFFGLELVDGPQLFLTSYYIHRYCRNTSRR